MQALIYTDMLRFFYETIKTIVLTLSPFVLDFLKSMFFLKNLFYYCDSVYYGFFKKNIFLKKVIFNHKVKS
jgi:hypothetical protein